MKTIPKSYAGNALYTDPEAQLLQYLRHSGLKNRRHSPVKGTLALLAPMAACALLPDISNAQCITVGPGGTQFLDIDEDGQHSFIFDTSFNYFLFVIAGAEDPGQAFVNNNGPFIGFYYVATQGSATQQISGLATINFNNFGGENISLPGTGNFHVIDANANIVQINVTIALSSIVINTVGGNVPTICPLLPIEWKGFDLVVRENSLLLEWQTVTETQNHGFEIERSTDGIHFYKIGWVPGEGTTQIQQEYQFDDKDIKPHVTYYYRLRQLDYDGTASFSETLSGKIAGDTPVVWGEIYPNPAGEEDILMEIALESNSLLKYQVYDAMGTSVLEGQSELTAGLHAWVLPVRHLPGGTYYLKVATGDMSAYKKWVKQ